MKLMAIDYGSKRVGIASTDDSGAFALPRAVWQNDHELLDKVLSFKEEEGIEKIILGESRNLDGSANPILEDINKFKDRLEEKGAEVILHTEVFTSAEAEHIQGKTDTIDASAAAIILKSYIDKVYNENA